MPWLFYIQLPFGLSVIEAIECGTTVIAFNRGSMPEIIENGKNGFLVNDIDEAIKKILLIESIDRRYCREVVEKRFTKEIMARNYINVYKRILNIS